MDELIYSAITKYYNVLGKTGYYKYSSVLSLLLLCFYRDFTLKDYRGLLSRADYSVIERALYCLFGTNCLIPYPDYLKMGKLHIGEMTEMAQRIKAVEDTDVLKALDSDETLQSDVYIVTEDIVEQ